MLPTKSNLFHQKFLMMGTCLLLLAWNHYLILDSVYNNKLIATQLKKQTLKKLIRNTSSKTVFSANNKL